MRRIFDVYYQILKVLMTSMLALLLIPVTMQVIARYTNFIPRYIWTEEVSRFAFIWIILLGAIIAVRDETHFSVDIIPEISPKTDRNLRFVVLILMTVAGVIFTYGGVKFALFGAIQTSELAGLPMLAIYIAWPVLGISWLFFMSEKLFDFFFTSSDGSDNHGSL